MLKWSYKTGEEMLTFKLLRGGVVSTASIVLKPFVRRSEKRALRELVVRTCDELGVCFELIEIEGSEQKNWVFRYAEPRESSRFPFGVGSANRLVDSVDESILHRLRTADSLEGVNSYCPREPQEWTAIRAHQWLSAIKTEVPSVVSIPYEPNSEYVFFGPLPKVTSELVVARSLSPGGRTWFQDWSFNVYPFLAIGEKKSAPRSKERGFVPKCRDS